MCSLQFFKKITHAARFVFAQNQKKLFYPLGKKFLFGFFLIN